MARVFTEGFEFGDLLFFNIIDVSASAATGANVRSGTYSLRFYSLAGGPYCTKVINEMDEGYFRFAFRYDKAPSLPPLTGIFRWRSNSTELGSLWINTALGALQLYVGTNPVATGTLPIRVNTWYLIEVRVKISDAGGVLQVLVDGDLDVAYTGDTKPGTATTFNNFMIGCPASGVEMIYDDLALNDTSGAEDNSWCGDGQVLVLKPTSDVAGAVQLMGSDGNQVDNYALVDDVPPDDDASYVYGSIVGERDLYELEDFTPVGVDILRIWMEARARETVADGGQIALVLKTYGVEYTSADIDLLTTYTKQVVSEEFKLNPDTGAVWNSGELNALQAGPKVR